MIESRKISDETISALIDGELSNEERLELLELTVTSDELKQRLCDAQYLKAMVKSAYPLSTQEDINKPRRRFLQYGAAATVSGIAVISSLNLIDNSRRDLANLKPNNNIAPEAEPTRVVFHISTNNVSRATLLLEQVELVLKTYQENRQPVQVEVVANNLGLDLLRVGHSPFPETIMRLSSNHQNLIFAACGRTMERRQKEQGVQVAILPEAIIVRSGVVFVSRRQHQGWSYIKV